jgi:hypothetical protein
MGGIMPNHERDKAIKRLRRAAIDAMDATTLRRVRDLEEFAKGQPGHIGAKIYHEGRLQALSEAWRAFPECEQDEVVPSPEEVIARCDAYDRQKEEQERILAREK